MVISSRLAAMCLALVLAPLPAAAQTPQPPLICDAKPAAGYFDPVRPQYLWSDRELADSESKPGQLLVWVRYLGTPTAKEKEIAKKAMDLWTRPDAAAGLRFKVLETPDDKPERAHIRILFADETPRSELGNLARFVAKDQPTMVLPKEGRLTQWIAVHQFGHALGLQHERLDHNAGWVTSEIFKYYWENGRCEKLPAEPTIENIAKCLREIETQVTLNRGTGHACPGDETTRIRSVMVYPVIRGWLDTTHGNTPSVEVAPEPSDDDRKCVNRLYPSQRHGPPDPSAALPAHYRQMYRRCLKKPRSVCRKIEVSRRDGGRLEFDSLEERTRFSWTWRKADRTNYTLESASNLIGGSALSRSGNLREKGRYYEGFISWEKECKGEAYVRLAETCPKDEFEDFEHRARRERNGDD